MRECTGCGRCCETAGNGGLSATEDEIRWWEAHRPDIARFVKDGRIWVDPATGDYLPRCPWLVSSADGARYHCEIYADRPEDCRHYPVDVGQMIRDNCEMLEPSDRVDHKRAQRRLDLLMIDLRPPLSR